MRKSSPTWKRLSPDVKSRRRYSPQHSSDQVHRPLLHQHPPSHQVIGSGAFYYRASGCPQVSTPVLLCVRCVGNADPCAQLSCSFGKDNLNKILQSFPKISPFQHSGRFLRLENSLISTDLPRFPTRPHLKRRVARIRSHYGATFH